ncbi:MAG: hypothetical protein MUE69_02875 [Myxococcota bacterium]|jgi:hypothetical protein|nr:hypothetical protein [Myxococcota bacterium]
MSKEHAPSDPKDRDEPVEVDDARPSFELPLPPGMQPLVEPSRERRVAPVAAAPSITASSTGGIVLPPAHTDATPVDVGFDPYALDASPLDALPGLEVEDVPRAPRAPSVAPAVSGANVASASGTSARAALHERALAFAHAHPRIVVLVVLALLAIATSWDRTERWPKGTKIDDEPVQEELAEPRVTAFEGYELIPKATYRVRARILSRERYRWGRESDLSSYDLALGWGVMSDQRVIDALEIRQGTRRYTYAWSGDEPAHPSALARQSANHHIIAGSPDVNEVIEDTPVGGALELEGDLVVVEAPDGWRWATSLSRMDVGDGACEIFHVKRARRLSLDEIAR